MPAPGGINLYARNWDGGHPNNGDTTGTALNIHGFPVLICLLSRYSFTSSSTRSPIHLPSTENLNTQSPGAGSTRFTYRMRSICQFLTPSFLGCFLGLNTRCTSSVTFLPFGPTTSQRNS